MSAPAGPRAPLEHAYPSGARIRSRSGSYRAPGTATPSSVTYFTPSSFFVIVNASRVSPTSLSVVDLSSHFAPTTAS
ncbi:hypothetical protein DER30_4291 [Streptomyces sp. HB202]|nr:hypothetical protein DER30_4291 [Streptomyces sp. HB202]